MSLFPPDPSKAGYHYLGTISHSEIVIQKWFWDSLSQYWIWRDIHNLPVTMIRCGYVYIEETSVHASAEI